MADHNRHLWRRKLLFIRMIIVEKLRDLSPSSVVSRRASVYNPIISVVHYINKHISTSVSLLSCKIVSAGLYHSDHFIPLQQLAGGAPNPDNTSSRSNRHQSKDYHHGSIVMADGICKEQEEQGNVIIGN